MTMEKFHHKIRGKAITLPHLNDLMTFGVVRKMRDQDEADIMFSLIEQHASPAHLAILDTMSGDETEVFFDAWKKDSGIGVGESPAS